jgi:flagellin
LPIALLLPRARITLDSVSTALSTVSSQLGSIGAQQSRFLVELSNLRQSRDTSISARSRIVDADIATESANLVRQQILQKSAIAMASQAAASPNLVLTLLRG